MTKPDEFESKLIALRPVLLSLARSRYRSAPYREPEDLVTEVLIRCLEARDSFQMGTNMKAWASFIMRNHFLSLKRKYKRDMDIGGDEIINSVISDRKSVPDASVQIELQDALAALSILPDEQRIAVEQIMAGDTYEDIAVREGIALGTAKSRVSRGRKAIRVMHGE